MVIRSLIRVKSLDSWLLGQRNGDVGTIALEIVPSTDVEYGCMTACPIAKEMM